MKIMLISDEIKNIQQIRSFTSVWSYFLPKALNSIGIEVGFTPIMRPESKSKDEIINHFESLDTKGYDHILALGLRYFSRIPRECSTALRARIDGAVAQIYDGGMLDSVPVDFTFTFRNDEWRYPIDAPNDRYKRHHQYNKYVGWAADDTLCLPAQPQDQLCILVDHAAFDSASNDQSLHVLMNVRELVRSGVWRDKFRAVRVRRFVDDGVEDCDVENILLRPYNRRGIPYLSACAEYSGAHLFMVTHRESVGLTVLETAMAGALPIVPTGYLPQDRLETVRHITYDRAVDWPKVLNSIDVPASRTKAQENSWVSVAQRIVDHLGAFEKRSPA